MKKKLVLNPSICIDQIADYIINKKQWEVVDKKYDFHQSYVSLFDNLNYDAKIDWMIAFKTKNNYIHKLYFYFLEFDNDHVFKISEIKSPNHSSGQITTRIANLDYYKTTGNKGFTAYKNPRNWQPYNFSHNYHNLFDALDKQDLPNEISYVCVLLKYHNHAQRKKRTKYYVNSYHKFIKSWITKIEKFEKQKTRSLIKLAKQAVIRKQKVNKKQTTKKTINPKVATTTGVSQTKNIKNNILKSKKTKKNINSKKVIGSKLKK